MKGIADSWLLSVAGCFGEFHETTPAPAAAEKKRDSRADYAAYLEAFERDREELSGIISACRGLAGRLAAERETRHAS